MTTKLLREAILDYCEQNERSISYVARKCEVSRSHLTNFLRGTGNISEELKKRIEDFLAGGN